MYEPNDFTPVTNKELEDRLIQIEMSVGGLELDLKEFREQMERRLDSIEDSLSVILKALRDQDNKLDSIEILVSN